MPNLKNKKLVILLILVTAILITAAYFSNFLNVRNIFLKTNLNQSAEVSYLCPTETNFCKSGKDISSNNTYLGLGGEVASGSAVLASFDGYLTPSFTILSPDLKNEKLVTLSLDNADKTIRAIYFFKGDWSPQREVKKGEIIGKILDRIEAFNTSLIFQIIKGSPTKPETVKLNSTDFTTN